MFHVLPHLEIAVSGIVHQNRAVSIDVSDICVMEVIHSKFLCPVFKGTHEFLTIKLSGPNHPVRFGAVIAILTNFSNDTVVSCFFA